MRSVCGFLTTLFCVLAFMLFLNSCAKTVEPGQAEINVYVVGYEKNDSVFVAELWNNGAIIPLGDGKTDSYAEAITISGSDIYIAGMKGDTAGYWKNGMFIKLSSGNKPTEVSDIFVSGGDVYVAGMEDSSAVLWKNGTKMVLSGNSSKGICRALVVVNGDVYCTGKDSNVAVIWKNGVRYPLCKTIYSDAYKIVVTGSDVYIAGFIDDSAVVWKNGIKSSLWRGAAYGLCISGSDIYTSGHYVDDGYFSGGAVLKKNGKDLSFPNNNYQTVLNSIFIANDKVYCSGTDSNSGGSIALYLSGDKIIYLTSGKYKAAARGIFVK